MLILRDGYTLWTSEEHMSCWLQCPFASRDLELALDPRVLDQLANRLDLPPTFGGAGVHSLINYADEECVGSFAAINSTLVSFC